MALGLLNGWMVPSTANKGAHPAVSLLPVLLSSLVPSPPRSAIPALQLAEEVLCAFSLLGLLSFQRCYQGTVMNPGYWNENSPKGNLVLWKNPVNGLTSWIKLTL